MIVARLPWSDDTKTKEVARTFGLGPLISVVHIQLFMHKISASHKAWHAIKWSPASRLLEESLRLITYNDDDHVFEDGPFDCHDMML